ncbi:MAG: amino acid permease [Bacteroidota bacterium]
MSTTTAKIGWKTAAAIVIANMIGSGVFTSLGFQLADITNTWSIVILWTLGGILGLFGAFTYAELGTHFKESGGDYIFLSRIFHPFVGYLYAWTSLIVGFSGPIAISALAMTSYLSPINATFFTDWFGIGIILLVTGVHSISVGQSGRFQDYSTLLKVAFVLALIGLGFYFVPIESTALSFNNTWKSEILLPGFAVSLIYVSYAYTGWNSAAYITDEIEDPKRSLPKALILATIFVTILYVLLQLVFLRHASVGDLAGKIEVATISFSNVFGETGGYWVSIFIGLQLVATISGYLWVGSRISYAMAKENPLWKPIATKNKHGIPTRALWLQAAISILLTLTGTFEQVLLYASFALQLMGTLTIAALLWLKRESDTYHSPGRPWFQIIYILFSIWVLGFMLKEQPKESLIGLGLVFVGGISFFLQPRKRSNP